MTSNKIIKTTFYILLIIISVTIIAEKRYAHLLKENTYNEKENNVSNEKYNRKKHFGSWKDFDNDKLNTRYEVIFSLAELQSDEKKKSPYPKGSKAQKELLTENYWQDTYSKTIFFHTRDIEKNRSLSMLQIDHIVPLKEAWKSGACRWSKTKRQAFYNWYGNKSEINTNFLQHHATNRETGEVKTINNIFKTKRYLFNSTSPTFSPFSMGNLTITHAHQNILKSDLGPAMWLPPNPNAAINFLTAWVKIKILWDLSASEEELNSIKNILGKEVIKFLKLRNVYVPNCQ